MKKFKIKKEFIDSQVIKYFIEIQGTKIELLTVKITYAEDYIRTHEIAYSKMLDLTYALYNENII